MIDDVIDVNLKFSSEMRKYLDENFDKLFSEAIVASDFDLNDTEDLVELEKNSDGTVDVILKDQKVRNRITQAILDDRIQNRLFLIEHEISRKTSVEGYS